jgi:sorting nexin-8
MVSTTLPVMAESAAAPPQVPASPTKSTPLAKPRQIRKDVLDEADPWGSPALHEGHNHIITPQTNGIPRPEANGIPQAVRTTSTFTTASLTDSVNGAGSTPPGSGPNPVDAWSSYGAESTASFAPTSDPGLGSEGFGDSGGGDDDRPSSNAPLRSFGGGRITTGSNDEIIQVTLLPEKEGMFMFQHHNYQVSSSRRGSKVVRRYSDFVWLLDCLQKRYPFRQLPLLPPKRVAGMFLSAGPASIMLNLHS